MIPAARMPASVAVVIVVAVLALLAGLAANRWLRPRLLNKVDDSGMAVKDLVGPLLTLTVPLLAFVLVTANGSYGKAEVASRGEARAVDQLVESAEYAAEAQRAKVQADAVCYARAVRKQEAPHGRRERLAGPQRVVHRGAPRLP